MKTLRLIVILFLLIPIISNAQTGKSTANKATTDKIEAYYFHFTARCVTCRTVEEQTKNSIETLYPALVKEGKITFRAINLDVTEGKMLGEKLKISGQTVLIVKGDQKINLTNEGFLYAVPNPDKYRAIIKEKIDGLLEL